MTEMMMVSKNISWQMSYDDGKSSFITTHHFRSHAASLF